jgi:hypothetical protein
VGYLGCPVNNKNCVVDEAKKDEPRQFLNRAIEASISLLFFLAAWCF